MRRYLLTRLALTVPLLFLLLTATFVLLRVAPGDPVTASLGDRASDARVERVRASLGLDEPLWRQYVDYLGDAARGDFGRAIKSNRPVADSIGDKFPATLELTMAAMTVALAVGFAVGALAARFRDSALDLAGRLAGIILYAAPVFWLGVLFQLLFSVKLGWLPSGGRSGALSVFDDAREITGLRTIDAVLTFDGRAFVDAVEHLVLPAVTLGLAIGGIVARLVRVNMLQTLRSDYVEAARARGVPERRVIFGHALRNALVPVVAAVGLQFALLLGGAVLTETTFTWPGVGKFLYDSLQNRDYTAVQGIVTFYALFVVAVSLLIDLATAVVDPRVRYS